MEANLLDKMLSTYCSDRTPLTIILQNKSRVSGKVRAFDSYVIVLDNQRSEIVYRHAISSIQPVAAAQEQAPAPRERGEQPKPLAKPARYPQQNRHKNRSSRPEPRAAAAPPEHSINTGMKEGLLKWMREQKAAK